MSQSTGAGHGGHDSTLDYRNPSLASRGSSMAKIGGALGVAGTFIGFAIFVAGCAGYGAAFALSPIPLVLGVAGLTLTVAGGLFSKNIALDDAQVVACYAVNLAVVAGAMLEFAIYKDWPIFYR